MQIRVLGFRCFWMGPTSAGLAVLGEFLYGALGDSPDGRALGSPAVLLNPYTERITLVRGFLNIRIWRIC